MKNIHMLPTEQPSRLYKKLGRELKYSTEYFEQNGLLCINQNIYITSNEEIKRYLDYYLDINTNEVKTSFENIGKYSPNEKKIILTTDQDLIKDGVQSIDDNFMEWFVKNPSCEEVETKLIEEIPSGFTFGMFGNDEPPTELVYKIILPKEEYEYIGECKGNNGNGCFMDSSGHDCGCFIKIPKEEPKQEQEVCNHCGKTLREQMKGCGEITCYRQFLSKQETLEELVFKVPFDYHIKPKEVMDMCMKEQQNIILTWRLGYFIDMINSLPDDIEKNRILKSVFDNRDGELLLESYKSMKKHYEK